MTVSELIMTLKNSYAELPELSCEELSELSHEELAKLTDKLISAVKLDCSEAADAFERAACNLNVEFYDDSPVELCTYPDHDSKFTKIFKVEHDWLIDKIIDLHKLNDGERTNLQNFLDNYIWEETEIIYQAAKTEHKLISEKEVVIDKALISHALSWGYIKLVPDPNECAETVCMIGGFWFYFGGDTAEELTPTEYYKEVPFDEIVSEIFNALEDFRIQEDFHDEYACYEAYLRDTYLQEQFVVDTLINAKTDYRRIPNSLWFEVFSPNGTYFSVVKITETGMIDVDGKIVFRDDFVRWADTMAPVEIKLEQMRSSSRTAFNFWIQQGEPEACEPLNETNFDIIEKYKATFENAVGYKFYKGIVGLDSPSVFCVDYLFNCTEENEKIINEAEGDFIDSGRFVRLAAALEKADGVALIWS